ncbi:unnamed protein product [Strongylus vulgaris]|uniref:THIF-type NAD/FAD binding fold domain-containing protein n=1 Tax=Strongylus vulgaris TaxID=40348 RepID=A0A3P7JMH9_STRVU|nr:unnamed protein product [Strongylus vulgaris]
MGWKDKESKKLEGKRFLVIGAGGIGCELLKNIALTGFNDIHVIDMDTIDVSNLNRQFLFRREHGKRFLVIGAGGIGCELLKNIALTGFNDIHVIDMDTIDVSNLNRQFLFRREHVGKSKAEVATQAIRQMCPDIRITFDLDNIFRLIWTPLTLVT